MSHTNSTPCQVCGKPSVANKMCEKHYRRWKKYGNANAVNRPDDWGKRNKHPLNQTWRWTARAKHGRVERWNDFWKFVENVGERPNQLSRLRRYKSSQPFGPDNFYWSDPVVEKAGQTAKGNRKGRAAYMRDWHKKNPLKSKNLYLKRSFGIDIDEYMALLESQNGKCAICGGEDEWFNLAVDHCHDKKHVRGLLCSQCNRGLGLFRDSPDLLRKAAEYLE